MRFVVYTRLLFHELLSYRTSDQSRGCAAVKASGKEDNGSLEEYNFF
jgi:hypothetical protein